MDDETAVDDPWDWLNFRYENDEVAQFTVLLDAVEEVVRKVQCEAPSDQRIALIVADYAADLLLAARVERVIALSQRSPWAGPRERFDANAKGRLRQGFNQRLSLAVGDYERPHTFAHGVGRSVLNKSDGEVLRVAHVYRNDAYHGDRHNERTLRTIVVATIHVVVRLWASSRSAKYATSNGGKGPLMERLLAKGYEPPDWVGRMTPMFSPHAGVEAVQRWLERELPIDATAQRSVLAGDIAKRVAWADAMVAWLASSSGPGEDEIDPGLAWNDFWRLHGDDPKLIALDQARSEAWERLMETDSQEAKESMQSAEGAYLGCFRTLMANHKPTIRLADLPRLAKGGVALAKAKNEGALLARYRTLDMKLRVFEETLGDIAISWDQHVEEEVDRARGAGISIARAGRGGS